MAAAETEQVVDLWRRSRAAAQPWLEERMRDVWTDDLGFFCNVIAAQNELWVAVDGQTIVGFLAINSTVLNYLYVDPPAQDRGVGTLLLSKAQELLPGGFTLFTHQRNEKARAFYERRGLRAVAFGISPAPESEPDVKYAWEPAPRNEDRSPPSRRGKGGQGG
jgi:ribosomal protein S18 acetylase RimI-like enzyme